MRFLGNHLGKHSSFYAPELLGLKVEVYGPVGLRVPYGMERKSSPPAAMQLESGCGSLCVICLLGVYTE